MRTTRLDEEEFTFVILGPGGAPAGRITHKYAPVAGGVSFYAETVVNFETPIIGKLLHWFLRPAIFSEQTAENWIKHNIEETGRTQDIVPICMPRQCARPTGNVFILSLQRSPSSARGNEDPLGCWP
jgi:hypothetical protein